MSKSSNIAVAYAVQRKNRKPKTLARADSERPTADRDQFAEGGLVQAGGKPPTANSGQEHTCTHMCSAQQHRDSAGNIIRAGSERPSANSGQGSLSPTSPTAGGENLRAGSSRPTADSDERTNSPLVSGDRAQSRRAASGSRPSADSDEMGMTQMLADGGEVEGEDSSTHIGTLAEAIASRLAKHMMAEGGMAHDDGLNENSEEHGNMEDDLSFDALGEEQFDDDQLSDQPEDSNESGDEEEKDSEDKEDSSIISKIRSRAKKKSA